jgi:hypothetical protein
MELYGLMPAGRRWLGWFEEFWCLGLAFFCLELGCCGFRNRGRFFLPEM